MFYPELIEFDEPEGEATSFNFLHGLTQFDSPFFAAIKDRGLKVKIIHTSNHTDEEAYDTSDLKRLNPSIVEVRSIDVASLLNSVGVLHSKLLIADRYLTT